jgi:hypothetical protein
MSRKQGGKNGATTKKSSKKPKKKHGCRVKNEARFDADLIKKAQKKRKKRTFSHRVPRIPKVKWRLL